MKPILDSLNDERMIVPVGYFTVLKIEGSNNKESMITWHLFEDSPKLGTPLTGSKMSLLALGAKLRSI
jgi:hypothetical protein